MKFTEEQVEEFIELYKKKSGVTLSRDEAISRATSLVLLVRTLIQEV